MFHYRHIIFQVLLLQSSQHMTYIRPGALFLIQSIDVFHSTVLIETRFEKKITIAALIKSFYEKRNKTE